MRKNLGRYRAAALAAALVIGVLTASAATSATAGAATAATTAARSAAATGTDDVQSAVLDAVVLVDQSGSLSDDDVKREREAVSTIAQTGLNSRSRVTVVGFGSNNGLAGQSTVTEFCPPTVLSDDAKRQSLADCSTHIVRRSAQQGNDTDHAAALSQAMGYFGQGSPENAIKAIFLLTDGKLDVHNSPQYGKQVGERDAAAEQEIRRQLADAAQQGVTVWPLGFGDQIDRAALHAFAAGGAQSSKNCPVHPQERIVRSSADVQASLLDVYAAAICGRTTPPVKGTLSSPGSKDLTVNVSPLATDGTVIVTKGDPRVQVQYYRPNGTLAPSSGTVGGATYGRSGENTSVEILHVVNPDPGNWRVHLTAPPNVGQQDISATVLWQGALRTSITVSPPSPRPGQKAVVRLVLLTRTGQVTDPDVLKDLRVSVTEADAQGASPTAVAMDDNGLGVDTTSGDGTYSGTITAPSGDADLTVTGRVSGPGVYSDDLTVPVSVRANSQQPQVRLQFDPPANGKAWAGTTIDGQLVADNPGGARSVRLAVEGSTPGLELTPSPAGVFQLVSGHKTMDVVLTVGAGSRLGATSLTMALVDANNGQTYNNAFLSFVVRTKPGWVEVHRTALIVLFLLLVLAVLAFLALLAARRRQVDVRKLKAVLRTEDGAEQVLAPQRTWSDEFKFVVQGPEAMSRRLAWPTPEDRKVYVARRSGRTGVRLRCPDGPPLNLIAGGKFEPLEDWPGCSIGFTDSRAAKGAKGSTQDRTAGTPNTGSAQPGSWDPYAGGPSAGPGTGAAVGAGVGAAGAAGAGSTDPYADPYGGGTDPYGGGSDPYGGGGGSDPYGGGSDPYGSGGGSSDPYGGGGTADPYGGGGGSSDPYGGGGGDPYADPYSGGGGQGASDPYAAPGPDY